MSKHIAVVAPAFNEAGNIRHFYEALSSELSRLSGYTFSVVFVDDGSKDDTFEIIKGIAGKDRKVSAIKLSRNFGHQTALLAGIDYAEGDILITMDSDMQHPPSLIPKLLLEYEKGNDIVFTFREDSEGVSFLRRLSGAIFYSLVNLVSDIPINRNASDFRLISRRVANLFKTKIRERNMFMRGMMSWVGFRHSTVSFRAGERFSGKSKYTYPVNIQFALFGLISFSKRPLRAAALFGFLFALFGFIFAVATVVQYLAGVPLVPGWATVIVMLSVFGGFQLIFLGVLGEYIGAIFDEVKGRPQYIVGDAVNIKQEV